MVYNQATKPFCNNRVIFLVTHVPVPQRSSETDILAYQLRCAFGYPHLLHNTSVYEIFTFTSFQGSITYTFPCDRWLARDEEDGAIERELVAGRVTEEVMGKDGQVKKKEKKIKEQLVCK